MDRSRSSRHSDLGANRASDPGTPKIDEVRRRAERLDRELEVYKQLNGIIKDIQEEMKGVMHDRNKYGEYNKRISGLSNKLESAKAPFDLEKDCIEPLFAELEKLKGEQGVGFLVPSIWKRQIKDYLERMNLQGSSSLPDFEMRDNPQTRHKEMETSGLDRTTIQNQADAASTSVSHTKHEITGASTSHSADPAEQITQALSEIKPVKVELSWTTKWVDEMREKLCLLPEEHRPQRVKKEIEQFKAAMKDINDKIQINYIPADLSREVVKITLPLIGEVKKFYTQACDYREGSEGRQFRQEGEDKIKELNEEINTLSDVLHVWKRVHEFQASLSEPDKKKADSEVKAAFQQFLAHYDNVKDGQDYKRELEEAGSGSPEEDLTAQEFSHSSRSDQAPNVSASQDYPSSLTHYQEAYKSLKKDLYEKLYKPVEAHKTLRYISKENDDAMFTYDSVTAQEGQVRDKSEQLFELKKDDSSSQGGSLCTQRIDVGDELGDYNLVKPLGEGGFGSHKTLRYISNDSDNDIFKYEYVADQKQQLSDKLQLLKMGCYASLSDSSRARQIGVGDELGDYNLVKPLGEGGFGRVFLGEHFLDPQKKVAIKVLAKDKIEKKYVNAFSKAIERFAKEIEYMASFDHPNIVRLLDFGRCGEVPFLVMEYAPYGTLQKKVSSPRGPLQPLLKRLNQEAWRCILHQQRVAKDIEQVAQGLNEIHRNGLVHCDIKPENILWLTEDEVKLGDLGLMTQDGVRYSGGTPGYRAPEQTNNDFVTVESDVYGLAVTAHELLSGKRPRQGREGWGFRNMIRRHTLGDTPHISRKITSPQVRQVLARALQTDRYDRYGYATFFAKALSQACQEQPQQRS